MKKNIFTKFGRNRSSLGKRSLGKGISVLEGIVLKNREKKRHLLTEEGGMGNLKTGEVAGKYGKN